MDSPLKYSSLFYLFYSFRLKIMCLRVCAGSMMTSFYQQINRSWCSIEEERESEMEVDHCNENVLKASAIFHSVCVCVSFHVSEFVLVFAFIK